MPSAIAHTFVPLCLRAGLGGRLVSFRLSLLAALSGALPDIDVLAFSLHIPYGSPWGHRGALHSLVAALAWALLATTQSARLKASRACVFAVILVSTASHTLLDAMTTGGKGVALLWPFTAGRFFFPFRPILVSPIGRAFFSSRGLRVLGSEICWVGLPALALCLALVAVRLHRKRSAGKA